MLLFKKIVNRILKRFQISRIETNEKVVYLTFDDGPEPGICEFVLDELRRYNFKATFFCRGDNAEKYPELLNKIIADGHTLGNHTYNHLHAYSSSSSQYLNDIERANKILQTSLLRPPFGCLTLRTWYKLKSIYHIVYWSLSSGDSNLENFDYDFCFQQLTQKTISGDIVLFHFCTMHELETKQILPAFCKWLSDNEFICKEIKFV